LSPERIVSPVTDVRTQAFEGQLVADVMLSRPKTLPADSTVQQVRTLLENASVQMVLLSDGAAFLGAIAEIPSDVPADAAASAYADPDPAWIAPSESAESAFELAARNPHGRLVVLDDRRNLVGLVCLDGTRTRFCGRKAPDSSRSSDGVITKPSGKSVPETVDGLRRVIEDCGFTVFNVIDHSGVAERAGVQMPESKLVMFGKPTVGATVMLAAPLAALDIPLKVLVWEDKNGAVSVSYNSPRFLAERHHLDGALRAPFEAVESIVDALLGA
jgi:uncharacterized protein (DUF302 family)/CBS domain-containing protein